MAREPTPFLCPFYFNQNSWKEIFLKKLSSDLQFLSLCCLLNPLHSPPKMFLLGSKMT